MANKALNLLVKFTGVGNLSGTLQSIAGTSTRAQRSLRNLSGESSRLKRELKEVRASLAGASGNVTDLMNRERQLEEQIAGTTRRLDQQRAALARVGNAQAAGERMRAKGQENLATGASLAAPLILAGKAAADFEDTMIDIGQKADPGTNIQNLQKGIMQAARAAKQMPSDIAKGVDNLAGKGASPEQAMAMIAPIAKTATAYRAEVEDLADAAYASVDNLKVPAGQTEKALASMAVAGKAGAFEIKDMAQYFPSLTAAAQGLGQKGVGAVADLSAALQITRKGAGDSASAANNLGNLLNKINTEDTVKNFKAFGIDLPAAMKKAAAAGKTPIEAITELTQQATKGDLSQLSKLFGDAQVQAAVRPLVQNIDLYRKIRADALAATGDVIDKDFEKRSKSASANFRALMGNVSNLAIGLGSTLLPAFVEISDGLSYLVGGFADWAEANPTLARYLMLTVAGLASLNLGLGVARIALGAVLGPFARVINLWNGLKNVETGANVFQRIAPKLKIAFTAIRTGAIFMAQGVARAGLFLLANPMVAALAVLGYLVYKHWDTVKAGFNAGVAFLVSLGPQFKVIGYEIIRGLIGGMTGNVPQLLSSVKNIALGVVSIFKKTLGIHSPSRVFIGLGGHIGDGLNIGLDNSLGKSARRVHGLASGIAAAGMIGMASPASAGSAGGFGVQPGQSVIMQFGPVTIHITAQPGDSPSDIAQAVADALKAEAGKAAATRRSDYEDYD